MATFLTRLSPGTLLSPDDILSLGGVVDNFEAQVLDVGDASLAAYVRAGRSSMIIAYTRDNAVTLKLQSSFNGETWYDVQNRSGTNMLLTVTTDSGAAFNTPPGLFYFRLACTVANSGPATCLIGYNGGY